ncbi:uncharacterized protein [Primulina huaijiensis]|uniref:uncharacterized protein n=1 Tax=Primulina huaijiensis TaxID=1492673 RepID=UPI003CC72C79
MDFTTEWKSRWTVSSTFSPPSFLSEKNPNSPIGPLIFTPKPNSPTSQLLHSPSLAPRLPPRYPDLSLGRVLQNCDSVPSTAASISSVIGPLLPDHYSLFHGFNSLQLLQIPSMNALIAFFPTGENFDRVGFTLFHVKDGILSADSKMKDFFQLAREGCENHMRITRLMVNPVDDGDDDGDVNNDIRRNNVVGFLMVCTNFSVYWYKIAISTVGKCSEFSVCLDYLGYGNAKMFKGNAVVSVSWSPYLREECLVLLENGDLLLFDVNYLCGKRSKLMHLVSAKKRIICKKMHVSLNNKVKLEKAEDRNKGRWFACEFCWHPKVFIVSHHKGVFLVDLRSVGECHVCCLLKLEMLAVVKNDEFVALSRAGSDGFFFSVATRCLLLLCDVRKPLVPVLRWAHGLQNPRYLTVIRLSELRANAENDKHKLASESGHCIFLGSFWDNEFDTFCYGPNINGKKSVYSEVTKVCELYNSWGLPSKLSLSGRDCDCGSFLVREELSKSSLPIWTDWRQKKQSVLGFGILDANLFAQLSTPYNFGGFILIRLMSSGKLEAQQFHVSWESHRCSDMAYRRINIDLEDNHLYLMDGSEYGGQKKFHHLKFEFLNAYLKDNLAQYIVKRREKREERSETDQEKFKVESNFNLGHEICATLKDFGLPNVRSSMAVSDILKDINFPTSIHDIALRKIWETLSTNMLRLAFSPYMHFLKNLEKHQEPLEFLGMPDQLQALPFLRRRPSCRSNKWSRKVKPSDAPVGPLLPPQFLTIFHKLCTDERKMEGELQLEETEEFSANSLFKLECDKVMEAVQDHIRDSDSKTLGDDFVSLADDKDEISHMATNSKFSYHKPLAFSEHPFIVVDEKPGCVNSIFTNHVFRRNQELYDISVVTIGQELFDVGCPVALKFEDRAMNFGQKELELYQNLKQWDLNFQKKFKPYQDYISRLKELK